MSWSASTLTTGNYSVALSGSAGICGNASGSNYYTSNSGATWTLSAGASGLTLLALSVDSSNGVGAQPNVADAGVYYTTDNGQNYTLSATSFTGTHQALAMIGSTALLGRSDGIWYSSNAGQTWTQSNLTSGNFADIAMSSSTVAIAVATNVPGIYYTTNSGQTWTLSSQTTGIFVSVAISGARAIASLTNGGIYYSANSGVNWTVSNFNSGSHNQIQINGNGQAISASDNESFRIHYSLNNGQTWAQSNRPNGFYLLAKNNIGFIAGSAVGSSTSGIYYSVNGGQSWTLSNYASQKFTSVAMAGNNAIAGVSGAGVAYAAGPLCFHRDTLVLCEGDQHRPIHELSVGDRVLTHRHGLVPIKYIAGDHLINGLFSKPSSFLYRHCASGLQVSGEHRMLMEPGAFPEEAREEQRQQYGLDANLPDNQVDGLLMWMACLHPDFERVEERDVFPMVHLVLEHDNEPMRHYGIFVTEQNLIAETCHEADFYKIASPPPKLQLQQVSE